MPDSTRETTVAMVVMLLFKSRGVIGRFEKVSLKKSLAVDHILFG
jgi:hypothetical protein